MIENNQNLRFLSDIANLHYIEKFVEQVCDEFNINTTYYGNILIAITEAVENAIKHGNQGDPEKFVEIFFQYDSNEIKFIIQDEGKGFDFNKIPDPTEINGDEKGRGIYLIKTLADNVIFSDNGSSLEICFQINNITQQTAINRINELQNFSKKKEKKGHTQKNRDIK